MRKYLASSRFRTVVIGHLSATNRSYLPKVAKTFFEKSESQTLRVQRKKAAKGEEVLRMK